MTTWSHPMEGWTFTHPSPQAPSSCWDHSAPGQEEAGENLDLIHRSNSPSGGAPVSQENSALQTPPFFLPGCLAPPPEEHLERQKVGTDFFCLPGLRPRVSPDSYVGVDVLR